MTTRIRLDHRATDMFENLDVYAARPESAPAARKVYEQVRDADFVIDSRDQVIKDRTGQVPRPAYLNEVEDCQLVRGDG